MIRRRVKSTNRLQGKHILVVEDHPAIGKMLEKMLADYDHPAHAVTGRQALEHIDRTPPDLVLLDLTLPDVNGLELARRIRQRIKSVAILAMSGRDVDKAKYIEAGCDDFILKPFDEANLLERMSKLLRSRPSPKKRR